MSKRILIIDDEENIRRVARLSLETVGYEVGEASDGEQGLEVYGDGATWDAVLLDERMPGIDGLETLRRIKERRAEARVIMITAYASIELAVEAMKLGATDFVRKPMTPEVLRGALSAALSRAEAKKALASMPVGRTSAHEQPLIETITMNGFEIIRPTESEEWEPEPDEYLFIVKSPEGKEYQVIVQISDEAVGYVERMTRRRLPASNSFWAHQAERLLSDYLWKEGNVPFGGRLTLKDIDRDDLIWAERWKSNNIETSGD